MPTIYLLWRIGDVVENNPRVVKLVLNGSICRWPLGPPLGRTEIYVSVDLLLLNIRHEREDVAMTVSIRRVDVPNPLINVIQWSQMLVPLHWHGVLCGWVKVRMCLHVPEVVGKYADRNFTLKTKMKITNVIIYIKSANTFTRCQRNWFILNLYL